MANSAPDAALITAAFAAVPVAAVALQGADHLIVAATPAYEDLIGRVDVVGRPLRQTVPDVVVQQIGAVLDRVLAVGRREKLDGWRALLGEGSTEREVFLDCLVVPWAWPDGRRRGVLVTAVDVSDRVRAHHREQARAIDAERRYATANDIALELQRALLPAHLPVLPSVELAARYLVAAPDQAAGGDWFDVLPLHPQRVALVVGDVVGRGVAASAAMGQLRVVLRHALHSRDGDITAAMGDLDRYAAEYPTLRATMLCLAVLDTADGSLTYCTRGHPAPLLVDADGTTRYLEPTGSAHLGSGQPAIVAGDALGPDDVLLLYSDGLVDGAGRRRRDTLATLAAVAGDAVTKGTRSPGAPLQVTERICAQAVEVLTRAGHLDDVTVLAVRRRTPMRGLSLDVPSERRQVAALRDQVSRWLGELPATSGQTQALALAVTEVAGNVVEHAYRQGDGAAERIGLTADLTDDGSVQIRVADGGIWQPASANGTGRGLWIAGSLVDELSIEHPADGGTVVVLRSRMRRPARLATVVPPATGTGVSDAGLRIQVAIGPPTMLTATGVGDASAADILAERIDEAGRGGMLPLTVDLTAVTMVASAGVRALLTARDRHQRHGTAFTVLAAPDTAVADVLELAGLADPATGDGGSAQDSASAADPATEVAGG